MAVIQPITGSQVSGSQVKASGGIKPIISTTQPVLQKQAAQPVVQVTPKQKKVDLKQIVQGADRFISRTAVSFSDLITESLDFTANFIVNNPAFLGPGAQVAAKVVKKKFGEERVNKWKDTITKVAERPKLEVDRIQQTEFIKPSEKWEKAPLKDKLTKHLGETLSILGPNIIPSFVLYAANPVLGVTATIASTGNDVRRQALENGVSRDKAELLGLGTGVLVGALDRIVPNELFGPAQKGKFISGFTKRVVGLALTEAGTEIAQEDIQIAAEATFRKDLGWDEVATRNAMAGLGGLLGGAGATTVVGTINNSFKGDILNETPTEPPISGKVEPEAIKETQKAVVKPGVSEAGLYDTKLKTNFQDAYRTKADILSGGKKAGDIEHSMLNEDTLNVDFVGTNPNLQRKGIATNALKQLSKENPNVKFISADITSKKAFDLFKKVYGEPLEISDAVRTYKPSEAYKLLSDTTPMDGSAVNASQGFFVRFKNNVAQQPIGEQKPQISAKPVGESGGAIKQAQPETPKPVGEQVGKPSKVGISIEAKAIEKSLAKSFSGTAEYSPITIKEQAKMAAELINSDLDKAKRVVLAQEPLPKGMRAGTILKAMEDYAIKKADVDLLRSIANSPLVSETSLHAQELRLLAERNPESPVAIMKEVSDARREALKKRTGKDTKEAVKNEVERIKKQVKAPDKYDWSSFLESIKCK